MVRPLHDISQPGTVILNEEQWQRGAGKLEDGRPVVPVSIDPYLSRPLWPHQVGAGHVHGQRAYSFKLEASLLCKLEDGWPVVPVSIDPYLSRLLRPHQVGVVHNLDKIEACSIFKLQKVVAVPCSRDKECSLQKLHQD